MRRMGRPARTGVRLAAGAVLLLAGCAGCAGPGTGQVTEIPPGPAAAADPAQSPAQSATAQVLAAYLGMRQAQVTAEADATTEGSDLGAYASGKAFVQITAAVIQEAAEGRVMIGIPLLDPRVTALDLTAQPPTATVTDCIDVGGWQSEDKATGQYVAVTSAAHNSFVSVSQAQRGPDGWTITETDVNRSKPC
jgi:hypothetical protein